MIIKSLPPLLGAACNEGRGKARGEVIGFAAPIV